MPLPIGWGDISQRLRRAFNITGRIPTRLDENVVPVAIVRDCNVHPFATDPAVVACEHEVAAIVGVQGTIGIANTGPRGSVLIIEKLWLSNSVAGGRIEVSKSGVLRTDGTFTDKSLADMSTSCLGLATAVSAQAIMRAWTVAPAATGGAIAQILRVLTTDQEYSVKAVLRAGEVVYVKNLSTNQDIRVSCAGLYYAQALPEV
jgi:hypothetical protein